MKVLQCSILASPLSHSRAVHDAAYEHWIRVPGIFPFPWKAKVEHSLLSSPPRSFYPVSLSFSPRGKRRGCDAFAVSPDKFQPGWELPRPITPQITPRTARRRFYHIYMTRPRSDSIMGFLLSPPPHVSNGFSLLPDSQRSDPLFPQVTRPWPPPISCFLFWSFFFEEKEVVMLTSPFFPLLSPQPAFFTVSATGEIYFSASAVQRFSVPAPTKDHFPTTPHSVLLSPATRIIQFERPVLV